jgi:hypothetical protein
MSLPNNPLRQFFRRPSVFLTLPSGGKYYADGVINQTENGELPVYPMTAIDEITARTPDALFNGEAVTQIIQSCVPDVLQPWAINNIDLDAILIAIRSASGDNNMEMDSQCPKCEEVNPYTIDLNNVLPQLRSPDFTKTLDISGLKIKFKPLTYKELNQVGVEQFNIQRTFANIDKIEDDAIRAQKTKEALQVVTNTTMKLVATAIDYIDIGNGTQVTQKDFIMDYLQNCDKNVYVELRDYTAKLREETQIPPLHIQCPNCQNEYDQPFTLNLSDFFG